MVARIFYGGTFDPPHIGHEALLDALHQAAPQAVISVVPAAIPVHKAAASASVEQRLAMLAILQSSRPWLQIDDREVKAKQACYTVDTLQQLRTQYECDSLNFVMGGDSFANLHTWGRWQQLLELANILVVPRPGWHWPTNLPQSSLPQCTLASALAQPNGSVVNLPWSMPDVASSQFRNQRAWHWVSDAIGQYIKANELYLND
ncbi:nicotinate (nicotinamide) nucleotide adenylyltransferase [Salinibius halmophilus]|uniref:nicotinate (nicotinamide) nucleotide adenylyltransferase n=1 Tax=Salinibius halmophilus TaxID=1853216 RepID=UPI000E665F2C|nr:nicotinate (nicotinamide) nucleotide adenylyltransferase [Salinibius halmophilus]